MDTADFVVVGAGIAGASAGYALAVHGTVVVVEQEPHAGYHTTGRSAAVYTEAYERGVPRCLARASRAFLEAPPEGFADHPLMKPLPIMVVGRENQRAKVEEAVAEGSRTIPSFTLLGPAEVEDVCPVMRPGYAAVGGLEPGAMEIDVHGLHQGFLGGLRKRGGRVLLGSPVTGLKPAGGAWTVTAGEHSIRAGVVVNAAGAWGERVAALAGAASVGLVPMRRTAFTFPAPAGVDAAGLPMVLDADEDFYFKPEGPQIMGSLGEETPMEPHDVRHDEADVALAIERIEAATTMRIRHVKRAWAGLRSFVPDRVPVIGMDDRRRGFFWLVGLGGYGIMSSAACARGVAGCCWAARSPG